MDVFDVSQIAQRVPDRANHHKCWYKREFTVINDNVKSQLLSFGAVLGNTCSILLIPIYHVKNRLLSVGAGVRNASTDTRNLQDYKQRDGTILIPFYMLQLFVNIQTFICNFASEMTTSYFKSQDVTSYYFMRFIYFWELGFEWRLIIVSLFIQCQILLIYHTQKSSGFEVASINYPLQFQKQNGYPNEIVQLCLLSSVS